VSSFPSRLVTQSPAAIIGPSPGSASDATPSIVGGMCAFLQIVLPNLFTRIGTVVLLLLLLGGYLAFRRWKKNRSRLPFFARAMFNLDDLFLLSGVAKENWDLKGGCHKKILSPGSTEYLVSTLVFF
jgi:hypothetical protein